MNSKTAIIAVAIIAIIAIVAAIALNGNDDSPSTTPSNPSVPSEPEDPIIPSEPEGLLINFGEAIEQDIVDSKTSGSTCSQPNHIFYVVPYTIKNNTDSSERISYIDVSLVTDKGIVYRPYSMAKYTDDSYNLRSGETYHGSWVFDLPENYVVESISYEGAALYDELPVDKAPERELGQVYAVLKYDIEFIHGFNSIYGGGTYRVEPSGSNVFAVVHIEATNVSSEDDIKVAGPCVLLYIEDQRYNYSDHTYAYSEEYNADVVLGYTEECYIVYEVPANTTESDISFQWDHTPHKGVVFEPA